MTKALKPKVPYSPEMGNFFRDSRRKAGFTQAQLAEELGLDPQNVSNWERGVASPCFSDLVRLTEILKVKKEKVLKLLLKQQEDLYRNELFKRA